MELRDRIENLYKSKLVRVLLFIYAAIFMFNAALTLMYPERYRAGANYANKFKTENVVDESEDAYKPISFKDKNLERVIRVYIGKGEGLVFAKDVAGITELDLRYQGIETLIDLRFFKDLREINLAYNKVSNLEGLNRLNKLEEVIAFENNISDISGISNLQNLKKLDLANNKLSDVSEIARLKKLETLNLSCNRINNISGFEELKNLKELDLAKNNIKDFSPLKDLKLKLLLDWGNK